MFHATRNETLTETPQTPQDVQAQARATMVAAYILKDSVSPHVRRRMAAANARLLSALATHGAALDE